MAAKNRIIKVNALAFHRAMELLKKTERRSKTLFVKKKPLSRFLADNSDYNTSAASIPIEVKKAILVTYGNSSADPSKLPDNKKMSDFDFTDIQYISLTGRFNRIEKNHNTNAKQISILAVKACDIVKDCVDLVTLAAS